MTLDAWINGLPEESLVTDVPEKKRVLLSKPYTVPPFQDFTLEYFGLANEYGLHYSRGDDALFALPVLVPQDGRLTREIVSDLMWMIHDHAFTDEMPPLVGMHVKSTQGHMYVEKTPNSFTVEVSIYT